MSNPAKLVKSCNLRSLEGVRDVDFGKSSADGRMAGDHSKDGARNKASPEYDDDKARMSRWASKTY